MHFWKPERYYGAAFETVEQMLEQNRPDAVVIATPPNVRMASVPRCLELGLSVLSEKPLAISLEQAEQLAGLARDAAGFTAIGFCHRFTPAVQAIRKLIQGGQFGRVAEVRVNFSGPDPSRSTHWMSDPAISGGGVAIDNAVHAIDLFQFLCGPLDAEVTTG